MIGLNSGFRALAFFTKQTKKSLNSILEYPYKAKS